MQIGCNEDCCDRDTMYDISDSCSEVVVAVCQCRRKMFLKDKHNNYVSNLYSFVC